MQQSALQTMVQVREYSLWCAHVGFSKLLSICTCEIAPNPRLAGRVIRVMGRVILLFTACFEDSVGFRNDINANLMQDVCVFSRETESIHSSWERDFNFPPSLWQDLSMQRGTFWIRMLGASVVIPEGTTHTCRTDKGQKLTSSIISRCQHSLDL